MSTPTLVKSWSIDSNNVISFSAAEEQCQKLIYALKEAMVASGGWAVVASSNSTSVKNVGDGSPDLWTAYTDIERASSGAHSWIAIYNSTLDITFVVDCVSSYDYQYDFYVVDGAVNANGTTSAKPTNSGAATTYSNYDVGPGRSGGATQIVWHAWSSSDNKAFRFAARSDGSSSGHFTFFIEEPTNTPDLWLDPVIYALQSSSTSDLGWTVDNFYSTKVNLYARVNGVVYNMYVTGESCDNQDDPIANISVFSPCDLSSDNGYLIQPMGIAGDDVGVRGVNGRIADLWWAPVAMSTGDGILVSASRDFVSFAEFLLPWDNSVPVIS